MKFQVMDWIYSSRTPGAACSAITWNLLRVQPHLVHAHEGRAVFSLTGFSPHAYGL